MSLYYLCPLSKGCGGKQWPEKILGSKRDSWCKLGIHSSVEFQTFIQTSYPGKKKSKEILKSISQCHDNIMAIIHREHLEITFSTKFTNFRVMVSTKIMFRSKYSIQIGFSMFQMRQPSNSFFPEIIHAKSGRVSTRAILLGRCFILLDVFCFAF